MHCRHDRYRVFATRVLRAWCCLGPICLAAGGLASADEGRIPIFEPIVLDATAGNVSGKYVVTRDITSSNPTPIIDIIGDGAQKVEIDLNGFTLTGHPSTPAVIRVHGAGLIAFVLRNGSVVAQNQNFGFRAVDVAGIDNNPNDRGRFEGLQISSGEFGILTNGVSNLIVRNNLIVDSGVTGIYMADFLSSPSPMNALVEENTIRRPQWSGVDVVSQGYSVMIRKNRVVYDPGIGFSGIFVGAGSENVTIMENNLRGGLHGIETEDVSRCRIANNVVSSTSSTGIRLSTTRECQVEGNTSSGNLAGIALLTSSLRNHLERNLVAANGVFGIYFDPTSSDNSYGKNAARSNDFVPPPDACSPPGAGSPCGSPDVCDEGTGNLSFGDNLSDLGPC